LHRHRRVEDRLDVAGVCARLGADDEPRANPDTVGAKPHHLGEPPGTCHIPGGEHRNRDGAADGREQLLERLGSAHVPARFDPLRDNVVATALLSLPIPGKDNR
jgi:hypothetical protein